MNVTFCTKKIYFPLNNPFFTLAERFPRSIEFRPPFIFDISLYDAYHYINLHSHRPIPRNDFKNLKHPLFQRLRLPGGKST